MFRSPLLKTIFVDFWIDPAGSDALYRMMWGKRTAAIVLPAFALKAVVCSVLFLIAAPASAQPPCHKESPKQEQCIDACKTISQEASGDRFVLPESPVVVVAAAPQFRPALESFREIPSLPPRTRLLTLQILLI